MCRSLLVSKRTEKEISVNPLFLVALTIGLISLAAAVGIYVYFRHKYKDKLHLG